MFICPASHGTSVQAKCKCVCDKEKKMDLKKAMLFEFVMNFIKEEIPWAVKMDFGPESDIVNDLVIYGNDCKEFLEKFCHRFGVECAKVDFSKCGDEIDPVAGLIVWIFSLPRMKKQKRKIGIKISELMRLLEESGGSVG
jgi:hypothetical protein